MGNTDGGNVIGISVSGTSDTISSITMTLAMASTSTETCNLTAYLYTTSSNLKPTNYWEIPSGYVASKTVSQRLTSSTSAVTFTFSGLSITGTSFLYVKVKSAGSYLKQVHTNSSTNSISCTTASSGGTGGGGTTTTYYYRMYDVTNGAYLDSSASTSTASSITRPSAPSGYTYAGYKYHTSFANCISQGSYDGTGTSCSTNSSYPYILFCYTKDTTTTTTYYYRCYDVTNGEYITNSTSTTSSSVSAPTQSGYTYAGYKRSTSWANCVALSSYTGTGSSASFTSSQKYVVFCYTKNSTSSWSNFLGGFGSYTDSTSFSYNLSAGLIGYTTFTAPSDGVLEVHTTGSSDTYGWLTNGYCELGSGNGSNALKAGTSGVIHTSDDDSGENNNFSFSYNVTKDTRYEIDWHNYSATSSASGTLYIVFTPSTTYYTVTCIDMKLNSTGAQL